MLLLPAAIVMCVNAYSETPGAADDNASARHHLPDGTFRNSYIDAIDKPFSDMFKWGGPKQKGILFPLAENDPVFLRNNRTASTLTWIGHSTLLLQYAGANIITDPHLGERASPVSFAGPERSTPPGLVLEELPELDIAVISHNHYDHLDRQTVERLNRRRQEKKLMFFVPFGLKEWFADIGVSDIIELDWGQSVTYSGWTVYAVPVQHWSGRTFWDRNETLWAGWVLERQGFRFFFAGDSGYSRDFQDLQRRFGSFDLSAIPIGAYDPRWFMKLSHLNPEEAVQVHLDLKSRYSVAIHWGTFQLTDEPMDEPPKRLELALKERNVPPSRFFVLGHGETRMLEFLETP